MKQWTLTGYRLAGILFLAASIPLLIWQVTPTNQITLSLDSFVAMHSSMEMFAIVVAFAVFFTAYGQYDFIRSARSILLSYAALATGLFDMLHMLSYVDMPNLYNPNSPHKAIVFWLLGRGTMAAGLLIYVLLPDQKTISRVWRRAGLLITILCVGLLSVLLLYYIDLIPQMFTKGKGLSSLKITMESFPGSMRTIRYSGGLPIPEPSFSPTR